MNGESWYLAVLVLDSSLGTGFPSEPLLDLQFRLVRARGSEDAYEKALTLGKAAEVEYENAEGEAVRWRFSGLHDLVELDDQDLVHGVEVYSTRSRRPPEGLVVTKAELSVFFVASNLHRTAREILGEN